MLHSEGFKHRAASPSEMELKLELEDDGLEFACKKA
jgi:hypothetical protein